LFTYLLPCRLTTTLFSADYPPRVPLSFFFFLMRPPPCSTLFPYTTLFRSLQLHGGYGYLNDYPLERWVRDTRVHQIHAVEPYQSDRKSTRLNSSHVKISYAVFCLKKKKIENQRESRASETRLHPQQPHLQS